MNPDRIIVERLHGHGSAWFDGEPQIAFGGATPAEAVTLSQEIRKFCALSSRNLRLSA
jgi:hypothetical protein